MKKLLNLKVVSVEAETADAVTIHLKQPLFKKIGYSAGQYLSLEFDTDTSPVCRSYSLSSTPGIDRHLSITVKRVSGGKVSNQLVQRLAAGDSVKTFGANGRFTLTPDPQKSRHLVLIAAGSGISPIFSILKSALHFEPNSRVSLIFSNRNSASVIFGDKLAELAQRFGQRLHIVHVLTQEDPTADSARLNRERTRELIAALPKLPTHQNEYYICGPAGMMEESLGALQDLQVPEQAIHLENFSPPKAATPAPGSAGQTQKQVSLQLQGKEFNFQVQPGQTLLDAALASGIQPPFSCRSGFCTACVCSTLTGEVSMTEGHGLSAAELKMGQALLCVGYPMTDQVRLEIK